MYERVEKLGVVAWNLHLPVRNANVEALGDAEVSQVNALIDRLRANGLTVIRRIDPSVATVFITSEGYVRDGELATTNRGDLRGKSLSAICELAGY
jgi:hypothetical protein